MKQTASWEGKSSFGKQEFLLRCKGRTKSGSLKKATMLPCPEFFLIKYVQLLHYISPSTEH